MSTHTGGYIVVDEASLLYALLGIKWGKTMKVPSDPPGAEYVLMLKFSECIPDGSSFESHKPWRAIATSRIGE